MSKNAMSGSAAACFSLNFASTICGLATFRESWLYINVTRMPIPFWLISIPLCFVTFVTYIVSIALFFAGKGKWSDGEKVTYLCTAHLGILVLAAALILYLALKA